MALENQPESNSEETPDSGGEMHAIGAFGARIRKIRRDRGWTLEETGKRTGLARSTLSKIETGQMSPTFDVIQKLARGLETDVADLFKPARQPAAIGRRCVTRAGNGRPYPSTNYDTEVLCAELSHKKMLPLRARIRARSIDEFSELVRHKGEEFIQVESGCVVVHTEFYEPVELNPGDSIYFDSQMGHALVSKGPEDAWVVWVVTEEA